MTILPINTTSSLFGAGQSMIGSEAFLTRSIRYRLRSVSIDDGSATTGLSRSRRIEGGRIRLDVFRPETLHHRLHFVWAVIVAIRQPVAQLSEVQVSGQRTAGMGSERRPRRDVRDSFSSDDELVSRYRGSHSDALTIGASIILDRR